MGTHDDKTAASDQGAYASLRAEYLTRHPMPDFALDALIYQALSESGRANLTGASLSTVSIGTRLHGMRLLAALDAIDGPGQSGSAPGQAKKPS